MPGARQILRGGDFVFESVGHTRKIPIADNLDLGIVARNLAAFYRLTGQFNKAEPLYQRSLAFKEKRLGPNHPLVATSLDGFGMFCVARGEYSQAASLLERALSIKEKTLGPEHP